MIHAGPLALKIDGGGQGAVIFNIIPSIPP